MTPNTQVQRRSFVRRAIGTVAWLIAFPLGIATLGCFTVSFLSFMSYNPAVDPMDWLALALILGFIGAPFGWLGRWGTGDA